MSCWVKTCRIRRLGALVVLGLCWSNHAFAEWSVAREWNEQLLEAIRDDCLDAQVPFFFKDWGAWCPFHIELDSGWEKATEANRWMYERAIGPSGNYIGRPRMESIQIMYGDSPLGTAMFKARLGAKDTGAMLDGEMWREFPGDGLVNRETWKPVNA